MSDWVSLEYIGEDTYIMDVLFLRKGMLSGLPKDIWDAWDEEYKRNWKVIDHEVSG